MTGIFYPKLEMEPLANGVNWRVRGPYHFDSVRGEKIEVPAGFVTDLASIPPVAWIGGALIFLGLVLNELLSSWWPCASTGLGLVFVFLSPFLRHDGKYTKAAVIHDWIYRTHMFSRARCDSLFLEMMTVLEVSAWQRWIIYLNVRAFGWIAWRNEKRLRHFAHPTLHA